MLMEMSVLPSSSGLPNFSVKEPLQDKGCIANETRPNRGISAELFSKYEPSQAVRPLKLYLPLHVLQI